MIIIKMIWEGQEKIFKKKWRWRGVLLQVVVVVPLPPLLVLPLQLLPPLLVVLLLLPMLLQPPTALALNPACLSYTLSPCSCSLVVIFDYQLLDCATSPSSRSHSLTLPWLLFLLPGRCLWLPSPLFVLASPLFVLPGPHPRYLALILAGFHGYTNTSISISICVYTHLCLHIVRYY